MFYTCSLLLMQIQVEQMLKHTDLTTDMWDEQPISCVEGEISTKNWNFEHESTTSYFHVWSWRNMFRPKIICFSWVMYENMWMQSRVGESVSWEFDEWKVSKLGK